ncbi:mechanosensitive ion channel family protein [Lutimonas sp.]|uniref:mechanosensitive ion channel family protein n=1 Tax=Lutimonas sp. TaxID=1872403 RepID=UPI003D9B3332
MSKGLINLSKRIIYALVLLLSVYGMNAQVKDTIEMSIDSVDTLLDSIEEVVLENPLEKTNRSSPRAVIVNFIENMNNSYGFLMKANERNLKIPGYFIADEVKDDVRQGELYFEKATYCLDLSAFPPSLQKDLGYGRAIMLKEILDRIPLPPLEEIPDYQAVELDEETKKHPKLNYWRIPETQIILVKTEEGVFQGEYMFSSETIEKLPDFYKQVKLLPFKPERDVSKGFYDFYISTPGLLMPPRWSMYLPEWSTQMYYSQTIWQWLAMLGALLIALIVIRILNKILIHGNHRFSLLIKKWSKAIFYACLIAITLFLNSFLNEQVNITGITLAVSKILLESVFWFFVSLLAYNVLLAMAEVIINAPKVAKIGIEATYTRATFMVIAIFVSVSIIVIGLSQIGVSIVPLLTGVGIGGLAIALAARSTLENVIGSFTIFADKPYRVNDRVKVLNYNGTIESIGIRSTQIRLLTGPLVSIPNEKMASVEIENIQARPYIRRDFDIRIKHGSSYTEVEKIVRMIRNIVAIPEGEDDHPNQVINHVDYPPRVFFNTIAADSFNISVVYWHFPPVHWDFMEHAEGINIQIIRELNESGIDFAFPTQIVHVLDGNEKNNSFENGTENSEENNEL